MANWPLREVLDAGVGADPERPHADVDRLECGHVLMGAQDRIGRRYPARRRCRFCAREIAAGLDPLDPPSRAKDGDDV